MKKIEWVYREMLFQVMEKKKRTLTQLEIAKKLNISLSTVNAAVSSVEKIGCVRIRPMNFEVLDEKRSLLLWASKRNLQRDILYSTFVGMDIKEIEKSMPSGTVFGAYSAYKFRFKEVPADYAEVYVYADIDTIMKRFPKKEGPQNIFVLKKDPFIETYGEITTIANTYVDLWNLRMWYAQEFIKAFDKKLFEQ